MLYIVIESAEIKPDNVLLDRSAKVYRKRARQEGVTRGHEARVGSDGILNDMRPHHAAGDTHAGGPSPSEVSPLSMPQSFF